MPGLCLIKLLLLELCSFGLWMFELLELCLFELFELFGLFGLCLFGSWLFGL